MSNKIFMTVKYVFSIKDVSIGHAYKLFRSINSELKKSAFLVVAGKVPVNVGFITARQCSWSSNCLDGAGGMRKSSRTVPFKDIVDDNTTFDKDDVLRLVSERRWNKLLANYTVYVIDYRRTRNTAVGAAL